MDWRSGEKTTTPGTALLLRARSCVGPRNRLGSAGTHLSQSSSDTLLGQAGLPLFLALLTFEALQRRQKPRRLWLAIDHGDRSFRNTGAIMTD